MRRRRSLPRRPCRSGFSPPRRRRLSSREMLAPALHRPRKGSNRNSRRLHLLRLRCNRPPRCSLLCRRLRRRSRRHNYNRPLHRARPHGRRPGLSLHGLHAAKLQRLRRPTHRLKLQGVRVPRTSAASHGTTAHRKPSPALLQRKRAAGLKSAALRRRFLRSRAWVPAGHRHSKVCRDLSEPLQHSSRYVGPVRRCRAAGPQRSRRLQCNLKPQRSIQRKAVPRCSRIREPIPPSKERAPLQPKMEKILWPSSARNSRLSRMLQGPSNNYTRSQQAN